MEHDWLACEREFLQSGHAVAGLDEVGRGALAGPVVVGAVLLTHVRRPPRDINDSKKLSPTKREVVFRDIVPWATEVSFGLASAAEIDEWGMSDALRLAASRALRVLTIQPTHVMIDGPVDLTEPRMAASDVLSEFVRDPTRGVTTIVGGDSICASIAAASIVAKVSRDQLMVELDRCHPEYDWASNKGYGSRRHRIALAQWGATKFHRQSWRLSF